MNRVWDGYLKLLSPSIRSLIEKYNHNTLQELRVRLGQPLEMVIDNKSSFFSYCATSEDIHYCVNAASKYSPWSIGTTKDGYIIVDGGHRIGLCGSLIINQGVISGFRSVTSLCIRVAHDILGIAKQLSSINTSILIIGGPGTGKTTLLRDLARQLANGTDTVCVVDEKGEIFPLAGDKPCFQRGKRMDVLNGSTKKQGIEMLLRNMNPTVIAVDEITAEEDCKALIQAGRCGIRLLATAHAHNENDLQSRPIYRELIECKLFEKILVMHRDKTWSEGRLPRI